MKARMECYSGKCPLFAHALLYPAHLCYLSLAWYLKERPHLLGWYLKERPHLLKNLNAGPARIYLYYYK